MNKAADKILVGKVSGVHGIQGWVKVYSYTRPVENLLQYSPWWLQSDSKTSVKYIPVDSRLHGKKLFVHLKDVIDRDAAAGLVNRNIFIERSSLPALPAGEFFWCDVIGLRVINTDGTELGVVENVVETGANDVIVVAGQQRELIPWVKDEYVLDIQLESGVLKVDWHGTQ